MPGRFLLSRSNWLLFGLAASVFATRSPGQSPPNLPVYVLSVSGRWQLPERGNKELVRYETVHLGEKVRCLGPDKRTAKLELLLETASFPLECKATVIEAPAGRQENTTSVFSAFLNAMKSLTFGTQALPVPAVVRSLASPADSVLCLGEDDSLDVAPAISALKARRYRLRFSAIQKPAATSLETEVAWTGQAPAKVKEGVPRAGLYRLEVVTADDAESAMGTWAAVRIAPARDCRTDTQALAEARSIVSQSNPPLSETGARNLYLLVLSSLEKR